MQRAVEGLHMEPDYLLLDAMRLEVIKVPQESIVKGDSKSISIAAASIIAKVERDQIMKNWAKIILCINLIAMQGMELRLT